MRALLTGQGQDHVGRGWSGMGWGGVGWGLWTGRACENEEIPPSDQPVDCPSWCRWMGRPGRKRRIREPDPASHGTMRAWSRTSSVRLAAVVLFLGGGHGHGRGKQKTLCAGSGGDGQLALPLREKHWHDGATHTMDSDDRTGVARQGRYRCRAVGHCQTDDAQHLRHNNVICTDGRTDGLHSRRGVPRVVKASIRWVGTLARSLPLRRQSPSQVAARRSRVENRESKEFSTGAACW